jgi:hypothetical protein
MFPRPLCIEISNRDNDGNTGDVGTGAARRGFHVRGTGNLVGTQRGHLAFERVRSLRRAS